MSDKPMAAPLSPVSPPAPGAKGKGKGKDEPRDSLREIAETIVFVVVLVLMLKTFVAEAFVIPTGSMAETLYGYQRMVVCEKCDYKFPVNCSSEIDPQRGQPPAVLTGCFCPNCQNPIRWNRETAPSWSSGDRVLVAKFLYDRDLLWAPRRDQVVVFKFPSAPQQGSTAMNYIKRCVGLPGETIAIFDGDLYQTKSLTCEPSDTRHPSDDPQDLWKPENMFSCDQDATRLFVDSMRRRVDGKPLDTDFQIIRRTPEVMMAMRRIVFDNDHQPRDLVANEIRRWQLPQGLWTGNGPAAPKTFTYGVPGVSGAIEWLTYSHVLGEKLRQARADVPTEMGARLLNDRLYNVPENPVSKDRRLITNMMGYNTGEGDGNQDATGRYWVSDLMLDFKVEVQDNDGELVLELSKGIDRFRAVFNIGTGECTLLRRTGLTEADREASSRELGKQPTTLKGKGTYRVRFANFDERLTVWVDSKLPFKDGVEYAPSKLRGATKENDLEAPAQIGARGGKLSVSNLQLWRDTFYTHMDGRGSRPVMTDIFGTMHQLQTMYVQPGHYLCMGDNSASSSDSRDWGLVPERLLLGRALVVYFPFWPFNHRAGLIR